jgi:LytR cell envelope-related transcriptional attenuator
MARVETGDVPTAEVERAGEEHLDDWFARRLQSQGIPSRLGGPSMPRALAVLGLLLALGAFLWALSSVGAHTSSSPSTTPTTNPGTTGSQTGGGTGGKQHTSGRVTWKNVTVDVLNGFGGNGAAASAASELRAKGWTVGTTGNATGIAKTEVVYLPGHRAQARAVARKLGLRPAIPIAQASGVAASATSGVAIVLGSDQLSNATP